MGTPQLRTELTSFIKKADERFLKMVHAMAVAYSNDKIVAYTTDGSPLTEKGYSKELEDAELDIKKGNVYSTAELKKQIRSWRKS